MNRMMPSSKSLTSLSRLTCNLLRCLGVGPSTSRPTPIFTQLYLLYILGCLNFEVYPSHPQHAPHPFLSNPLVFCSALTLKLPALSQEGQDEAASPAMEQPFICVPLTLHSLVLTNKIIINSSKKCLIAISDHRNPMPDRMLPSSLIISSFRSS